jgi:hypothetical protein
MVNFVAASVLAAALMLAGHLAGGRYTLIAASTGGSRAEVYRLDRFTGTVHYCTLGTCEEVEVGPPIRAD